MLIEVLGIGCAKCIKVEELAKQAIKELGINAKVTHITDLMEISKRGVLMTPGLVIDGKVVSAGKLPSLDKIKELIQSNKR